MDPRSEEAWLIDFARTGPRASILDIAALEAYIKLQLFPLVIRRCNLVDNRRLLITDFRKLDCQLLSQNKYEAISLPNV